MGQMINLTDGLEAVSFHQCGGSVSNKYSVTYYTMSDCQATVEIDLDNLDKTITTLAKLDDFYKLISVVKIANWNHLETFTEERKSTQIVIDEVQ